VLYTDLLGTLEIKLIVYTQAVAVDRRSLQHSVITTSALYFDDVHLQSRLNPDSTRRGVLDKVTTTNCRRRRHLARANPMMSVRAIETTTKPMIQNCGGFDDDWLSIVNSARGVGIIRAEEA